MKPKSETPKKTQYYAVTLIGLGFLLMFTTFNSLQNMISAIYSGLGLGSLGQLTLLVTYSVFGVTTLVSAYIIHRFGYKKTLFFSGLGVVMFEVSGLVVVSCRQDGVSTCAPGTIYVTALAGATVCGFCLSLLWIVQTAYISDVADPSSKPEMFALFWALMMSSQIFGNMVTTFLLGNIQERLYFAILSAASALSCFVFLALPKPPHSHQRQKRRKSLSQQVRTMTKVFFQRGTGLQHLFYSFTGVLIGCYSGFMYQVVGLAYPRTPENQETYSHDLKLHIGYVFMAMGCSSVTTGLVLNRVKNRCNQYRLLTLATLLAEVAAVSTLLAYFVRSYELCFVCAVFWGVSETTLLSSTNAVISVEYRGRIEAFGAYRVYYALGISATMLVNIVLMEVGAPGYLFVLAVLAMQVLSNLSAMTLEGRDRSGDDAVFEEGEGEEGYDRLDVEGR